MPRCSRLRAATFVTGVAAATPAAAASPPLQVAQATDNAAPTDIGRVTANGGAGANAEVNRVKPSGTGTRAQAKAAEKAAPNKIIVQPQSEIIKYPDVSIAQALSRLPGISLETDTGEGRFIDIRGLDADLNATTFDGVRIMPSNLSSPTGGGRAVAYDALPAGLVGGIEVSETLKPEDDAEGLGGLVNLLPRRAPANGQPFFEATAGLGVETLRDTQITEYGFTAGASFGLASGTMPFDNPASGSGFLSNPKPFSFIVTLEQHNDFRGIDDNEPSFSNTPGSPVDLLNGISIRHYLYNRRRFDHGFEFNVDPNDDDHFFIRFAQAGYNEHAEKDKLDLSGLDSGLPSNGGSGVIYATDPSGNTYIAPAATAQHNTTDSEEEIRNQILEFGGSDIINDTIKLDYRGAYSVGTDKFPTSYGTSFTFVDPATGLPTVPLIYKYIQQPSHLFLQSLDGANFANPADYASGTDSNGPSSNRDGEWSGAVNVSVPFAALTPDDNFKAGAFIRLRDRSVQTSNGTSVNLPGTLADYAFGPDVVFYDGFYNIGPSVNAAAANRYLGNLPAPYDPTQFQHDTENIYGGYVQYSGKLGRWSWLAGMRLESTFGSYAQAPGQSNFVDLKHAYTSYFPSVHIKYDITPTMDVRAIYSSAIGRPGFQEISPGAIFTPSGPGVNVGNPNLSPEYADAFDLVWEDYLPHGGKVSLAGFDKELNTFIFQKTLNGIVGAANYPNYLIGPIIPASYVGQLVPVTTYVNSGASRVYGVEAEETQQFLFLPAPWDGFGIDSNLTYNQSSALIQRANAAGVVTNETLQLPQTSPWNFNTSLFYEKGPYQFRLAGNYVSKDLYSLGSTKSQDTYVQQRFRLDFSAAYQVIKNVQLYFYAHNLTDQTLKYTQTASQSLLIQREFYGVDVMGGLRVTY
jgi:TonB-dependent receptor